MIVCTRCGKQSIAQKLGFFKKFDFIRHGETRLNRENICIGSIDEPLSREGEAQAEQLAERLKNGDTDISLIVTSPLKRAHRTAEIISNALGVEIFEEPRLRERCVGVLEGKFEPLGQVAKLLHHDFLPDQATPLADFEEETREFLEDCTKFPTNILFVTHGFRMLVLIKLIRNLRIEEIIHYPIPGNCKMVTFLVGPNCGECQSCYFEQHE